MRIMEIAEILNKIQQEQGRLKNLMARDDDLVVHINYRDYMKMLGQFQLYVWADRYREVVNLRKETRLLGMKVITHTYNELTEPYVEWKKSEVEY